MSCKPDEMIDLDFRRLTPEQALALLQGLRSRAAFSYADHLGRRIDSWRQFEEEFLELPLYVPAVLVTWERVDIGNGIVLRSMGVMTGLSEQFPESVTEGDQGCFLEMYFHTSDVEPARRPQLAHSLMEFCSSEARRVGVDLYYGGIEPAADRNTRMFTGTSRGPVGLNEAGDIVWSKTNPTRSEDA